MYSVARSKLTMKLKRLSRDFTSLLLTSKIDFRGSCKRGSRKREKNNGDVREDQRRAYLICFLQTFVDIQGCNWAAIRIAQRMLNVVNQQQGNSNETHIQTSDVQIGIRKYTCVRSHLSRYRWHRDLKALTITDVHLLRFASRTRFAIITFARGDRQFRRRGLPGQP